MSSPTRNAREYRRLRELLKFEQAKRIAASNDFLSGETAPLGTETPDAFAHESPLPDDVKETVLFGRLASLPATAPTPTATGAPKDKARSIDFNDVPPLDDLRAVRRQLWPGEGGASFNTEDDRSSASTGYALEVIIEARALKPRGRGKPAQTGELKKAFDALATAGIPIRIGGEMWRSPAEQHLMETLGYTESRARMTVRRLRDLHKRLGGKIRRAKPGRKLSKK